MGSATEGTGIPVPQIKPSDSLEFAILKLDDPAVGACPSTLLDSEADTLDGWTGSIDGAEINSAMWTVMEEVNANDVDSSNDNNDSSDDNNGGNNGNSGTNHRHLLRAN